MLHRCVPFLPRFMFSKKWDVSTCTNSNMACNSYQLYHHVLKVRFFSERHAVFYILHTNSLRCSYFDRLKRLGCFWLIVPSVQTIYPPKIDICSPRFTFSNVAMDNSPFSSMISPIYIHNIIKQHVSCDYVYIYMDICIVPMTTPLIDDVPIMNYCPNSQASN